jgi:ribA/ribD-fused uncharacterized protein
VRSPPTSRAAALRKPPANRPQTALTTAPTTAYNRRPTGRPTAPTDRQAVSLIDTEYHPSGPDLLVTGYLPASGGLLALERALSFPGHKPGSLAPGAWAAEAELGGGGGANGKGGAAAAAGASEAQRQRQQQQQQQQHGDGLARNKGAGPRVVSFYKAWDEWGALGNFSPHPITVPGSDAGGGAGGDGDAEAGAAEAGEAEVWPSVEHYYQAAKLRSDDSGVARALAASIRAAESPEEAARIGRRAERATPELVRPDWAAIKRGVMMGALRAKFTQHEGPRRMLLSTAGDAAAGVPPARLVEASPNDTFWGQGFAGGGRNQLGALLMELRDELAAAEAAAAAAAAGAPAAGGEQRREAAAPVGA